MFAIQRPIVLLALLLLLPASFFVKLQLKKLSHIMAGFFEGNSRSQAYRKIHRSIILRTLFRSLSWVCAVCAFAGFSWGTKSIPVQKNGSTVCFVFDISYSMTARDAGSNLSRLEAAALYAKKILPMLEGSSFSAVLTKGEGFVAIPETEDLQTMDSLISNLSPAMVSTPGTSLGKGLHTALHSLSLNSAKLNYIWVFTDGDETDNLLKESLDEASRYGIPVTLVGFGSENEVEIISGDGKTPVKTGLKEKKLKELASGTDGKKYSMISRSSLSGENNLIRYINSKNTGSAFELLNQINAGSGNDKHQDIYSYEIISVKRHSLFMALSVIFFLLSFAAGELNTAKLKKVKKLTAISLILAAFTSCSNSRNQILEGSWNWYQGKYNKATAQFLKTTLTAPEESMARQYALFNLSSTYISLDEYDAALDRISQMMPGTAQVPPQLESAAYYNAGLIYQRKNDFMEAASYYKKAILSDSRNLDARINLELCQQQLAEKQSRQAETEMQKVSEGESENNLQKQIFNLIRENEDKQWKKPQTQQKENNVLDY